MDRCCHSSYLDNDENFEDRIIMKTEQIGSLLMNDISALNLIILVVLLFLVRKNKCNCGCGNKCSK